jgi:hypothetical protein
MESRIKNVGDPVVVSSVRVEPATAGDITLDLFLKKKIIIQQLQKLLRKTKNY